MLLARERNSGTRLVHPFAEKFLQRFGESHFDVVSQQRFQIRPVPCAFSLYHFVSNHQKPFEALQHRLRRALVGGGGVHRHASVHRRATIASGHDYNSRFAPSSLLSGSMEGRI
uniref:Uncharacterized protein n=1 Tax=Glycine max TaxID=3847 RepID=C6T576_SOYBN|nr:unknown [Glycine max]